MSEAKKDTLYIDAEEEITGIIEKVVKSTHKIVVVVVPKHATVFQSVVNMKLLSRAAKGAKKNLVLVTSDKSVLPVAAATSVLVSKTPTSKPAVPIITNEDGEESESLEDEEIIELEGAAVATTTDIGEEKKAKSGKKIMKIPDFSSFRLKLTLGIAATIGLVLLWFVMFVVMPKATITIRTDSSTVSVDATMTTDFEATEVDLEDNIIPAERVQSEKVDSVTVEATGQKNVGARATGRVTLTNCIKDDEDKVIASGTRFSSGELVYETTEQIILGAAAYVGNNCISGDFPILGAQGTVDLAAIEPGSKYNKSEGALNSSISGISAFGSAMTGGSDEVITVVSQEDVDKARAELAGKSRSSAIDEMKSQLQEKGLLAIEETLGEGEPVVQPTPGVDQEASEVEVTMNITYNLTGVKEEDLSQILDNEVQKKLGDRQQNIADNGLQTVDFIRLDSSTPTAINLNLKTVATTGPDINEEQIKENVIGKKRGEIEQELEAIDGVRSVSVEYSPVWVTTTPKSTEKIDVVIENQNE